MDFVQNENEKYFKIWEHKKNDVITLTFWGWQGYTSNMVEIFIQIEIRRVLSPNKRLTLSHLYNSIDTTLSSFFNCNDIESYFSVKIWLWVFLQWRYNFEFFLQIKGWLWVTFTTVEIQLRVLSLTITTYWVKCFCEDTTLSPFFTGDTTLSSFSKHFH